MSTSRLEDGRMELVPCEPLSLRVGKKYHPGPLLKEEGCMMRSHTRIHSKDPVTGVGLFQLMGLVRERRKSFRLTLILCNLPFTLVIRHPV